MSTSDDHIQTFSATLTLTSSHPNASDVNFRAPRVGAPIHIAASRNPDDTWHVDVTRPTENGDFLTVIFPGDGTAPLMRNGSGGTQPFIDARSISVAPVPLAAGPVIHRLVEGLVLTPTEIEHQRMLAEARFGAPSLSGTEAVFHGTGVGQSVAIEQRFDAASGLLTAQSVAGAGVVSTIHHEYATADQGSYYRQLTRVERSKDGVLQSVVELRLSDVSFSVSK